MVETVLMSWAIIALPVILGGVLGMLIGIFCDR
jgi:hypothetical protein